MSVPSAPSTEAVSGRAWPPRYSVERVGHPDPAASRYAVLDVVHDFDARAALASYGNHLLQKGYRERAQEVFGFLDATKELHRSACEKNNELQAKLASRKRR